MSIAAGQLDETCELLRPVDATDAAGGPVTLFEVAGRRACQRRRLAPQDGERDPARAPVAQVQLLLRLDRLADSLSTRWRLRYQGEDMLVVGLDRNRPHGTILVTGTLPQED